MPLQSALRTTAPAPLIDGDVVALDSWWANGGVKKPHYLPARCRFCLLRRHITDRSHAHCAGGRCAALPRSGSCCSPHGIELGTRWDSLDDFADPRRWEIKTVRFRLLSPHSVKSLYDTNKRTGWLEEW